MVASLMLRSAVVKERRAQTDYSIATVTAFVWPRTAASLITNGLRSAAAE
jgi:hypothetical protein